MRGKPAPKRTILPDSRFHNITVAKLVNYIMRRGKKTIAEKVVYRAFEVMADKSKKDPLEIFDLALKNVMPTVEVKSRRVGGANYQIPTPVRGERKLALAFRWIIAGAKAKRGIPMHQKLADEFLLASNNEGAAIKKKLDVYRMAEANRAFAHFAR
ncbi:30S ribosomal protein S7 [Candidatus Uhrbacteria bacterium]|nr:30S ribosomal protein S7 [Candidatus Uhrbacteria bacterium]